MKPVIIYSMPRTFSTAAMHACKREIKIFEPFNVFELYGINHYDQCDQGEILKRYHQSYAEVNDHYPYYANSIKNVDDIFSRSRNPQSVTKIISTELYNFLPARRWLRNVVETQSHKVFVLTRDLREQMLSFLIANRFGFFKETEIEPFEITIEPKQIFYLRKILDTFLRFYPKNSTLIDFSSLPVEYFDKSQTKIEPQDSMQKLHYIKNIDYCEFHIEQLIRYYQQEWSDIVGNV